MLQRLSREEMFLAPLVCQEAEVVFCIVPQDIKCVEKHYCCIMHINTRITEGKLSSRQEAPLEFVAFPRHILLPSAKWSFQARGKNTRVQSEARVGLELLFSSLPDWIWPLSFSIPDTTRAHIKKSLLELATYTDSLKRALTFLFGQSLELQQYLTYI